MTNKEHISPKQSERFRQVMETLALDKNVLHHMRNPYKKQTKQWKTRDGRRIRICDMSDSHLVNTIRFLEMAHNRLENASWSALSMLQGEMATYYAEQEVDAISEGGPSYTHPIYDNLIKEKERRQWIQQQKKTNSKK